MRKAVWLALAGLMSACYRPDLERCRIRCTEACPAQLTCGPDGFCHSSGDELCTDDGDGGVDGSVTLDYLSISIGRGHACGLRQGGALRCWGENALGQLGVNTTEPFEGEPQDVPGTFRQVSVGDSHTCAIRDDGHLACWGWNEWGQVGVDPQIETNVTAPEDVDDNTDWIRVSAGRFHTCGIRGTEADGGVVYCWGADDFGQLGDGSAGTQRFTPMAIDTSITGWRQIGAGGFHSCASWDSETYCWGAGDHGETGDPALAQHASPFTVPGSHVFASLTVGEFVSCGIEDDAVWCWGEQPDGSFEADPQTVASGSYTLVSTNYYNTCAVHSAGVRCWGVGDEGQYGDGSWEYGPGLHDVEGLTGIISISAGRIASCAVDGAGGAWCWGSNAQGQLGVGTVATQFTPKRITTLSGWDKVVAGVDHSCAIHDGDLWCWGLDGDLQLGAGTADSAVPVQVTQTGWIDVALGNKHTCGLLDVAGAHQLWCWGDDTVEQLGNSGLGGDRAPARIGLFDDYETIVSAFGDGATCATRPGDLRWCWGEEVFGQLGDGSSGGHLAGPTLINDGAWTAITLGYQFGCGVKGGDLFCFGTDLYQQQGRTAGDDSSTTPVATETTLPWTAVAAGGGHACAIESGNVWCWGDSTYGNVGDGFTGQREIPTSIRTGSQVTAGLVHTCAIDAGALYCWGGNYDGQLGEPTLGDGTLTPQPIAQTQAWSSVSAGYVHTCAIEDVTGDLYCWGDGRHGQLGNGAMSSNVPVSVH